MASDTSSQILIPPGNWLAHQIKLYQENSEDVFPPQTRDGLRKYTSIYKMDFIPKIRFSKKTAGETLSALAKKRRPFVSLQRGHPRSESAKPVFKSWKIPKKVMEDSAACSRERNSVMRRSAPPMFPHIGGRAASRGPSRQLVSGIGGRGEPMAPPTPEVVRISPPRALAAAATLGPGERPGAAKPGEGKKNISPITFQPTYKPDNPAALTSEDIQFLKCVMQPQLVPIAEEYMRKLSQEERQVIMTALTMSRPADKVQNDLKRVLLPDLQKSVMKWLHTASDDDKEVAVRFFQSIAGTKIMGAGKDNQRLRLNKLLNSLQRSETFAAPSSRRGRAEPIDTSNLKYVRLLSADTRNRRTEKQTWHHMPQHAALNPTDNISSHFTRSNYPVPFEFKIHPDWGPS